MAYVGRTFDSLRGLLDYLDDIVVGEKPLPERSHGLDGKTLIINNGADVTVTFSGDSLSPIEVVSQINAAVADAATLRSPGYGVTQSYLAFDTPTHVIKHTGTANAVLGLSTSNDATVGASAVAPANIVSVTPDGSGNKLTVIHT